MKSKFLSFVTQDWIKAFWMFLFSTIVSIVGDAVLQAVANGTYSIDGIHWKAVGASILVAVVAYLQKQLLSNSNGQVLKKEPETK